MRTPTATTSSRRRSSSSCRNPETGGFGPAHLCKPSRPHSRGSSGSSNENVEPFPSVLSKSISPPCRRTMRREIASPRPVPSASPSRPTRMKGRNTSCRLSSGMPIPFVRDGYHEATVTPFGGDRDRAALGRVLECVREQVSDHLADAAAVGADEQRLIRNSTPDRGGRAGFRTSPPAPGAPRAGPPPPPGARGRPPRVRAGSGGRPRATRGGAPGRR